MKEAERYREALLAILEQGCHTCSRIARLALQNRGRVVSRPRPGGNALLVLQAMEDYPLSRIFSASDIAHHTGLSDPQIRTALFLLKDRGFLERVSRGRYRRTLRNYEDQTSRPRPEP